MRWAAAVGIAIAFLSLSVGPTAPQAGIASSAAAGQTIVSITFDDGSADQYQGLAALNAHGMHATYFLNSPKISGDSDFMTWSQIAGLAAAGNEIGGHTAYHADLPFIDPTEAQRQICYDRHNLLDRGYQVAVQERMQLLTGPGVACLRRLQPGGQADGAELRLQLGAHHRRLCAVEPVRADPAARSIPNRGRHRRHDVDVHAGCGERGSQ